MADVQIFQRHWLIRSYLKSRTRYFKRTASVAEIRNHLESHNIAVSWKTVDMDLRMIETASPQVRRHPLNSTRWYYDQP